MCSGLVLQIAEVLQTGLGVVGHRGFVVRVGLLEGVEPLVEAGVEGGYEVGVCVGDVGRFVRVGLDVVEFLVAVRTANVAVLVCLARSK